MAKFAGKIGVLSGYTTVNGISKPDIKTYDIYGDVIQNNYRIGSNDKINEDLTVSNRFSFIAPEELMNMFAANSTAITALYIEYFGIKLKVTDITFAFPRVTVSVGGFWNEQS